MRKSQWGVTLIELLVVIAVFAVMSLAMATMFSHNNKLVTSIENKDELANLTRTIQQTLANAQLCSNILAGQGETADLNFGGTPPLTKGQAFLNGRVMVKELKLDPATISGPLTSGFWRANIKLEVEMPENQVGGRNVIRAFPFFYRKDGGGNILSCAEGLDPSTSCAAAGGIWDASTQTCDMCVAMGGYWDNSVAPATCLYGTPPPLPPACATLPPGTNYYTWNGSMWVPTMGNPSCPCAPPTVAKGPSDPAVVDCSAQPWTLTGPPGPPTCVFPYMMTNGPTYERWCCEGDPSTCACDLSINLAKPVGTWGCP